ncbi:S41 family peptidase [Rheinheimera gaetbuli]
MDARWVGLMLIAFLFGCGGSEPKSEPVTPPVQQLPQLPETAFTDRLPYLASFFQLAGQVRYHHPGDAVANSNWDAFLAESAYLIATASDTAAALSVIQQRLSSIAPDISFNGQPAVDRQLDSDSRVLFWLQNGYDENDPGSVYARQRISMAMTQLAATAGSPASAQFSYQDQLLSAVVPQVNRYDGQRTLPLGNTFHTSQRFRIPANLAHPMVCLAVAGELWSVIANFYPYFLVIDVDWQAELPALLSSCATEDRQALIKQIYASLTKLQDNHIVLINPYIESWLGNHFTPVRFDLIENKVVAVHKTAAVTDIEFGDELLEINGQPVADVVSSLQPYSLKSAKFSANTAVTQFMLRGALGQQFTLTLRNKDGQLFQQRLSATEDSAFSRQASDQLTYKALPQYQQLSADIAYVNVSKTQPEHFAETINNLRQSRAVVLDLRNYPQSWEGWRTMLGYFATDTFSSLPMYLHYANHPDPLQRFRQHIPQSASALTPRLTQPVVVLSSRYSVSQNEHALGYAQSAGLPILGEPTFGINGNITFFNLLGGIEATGLTGVFTGMEVTQHDGSALIGVGIQPDILVPLTVEGIRQQRDVQLDAAIEYLQQRIALLAAGQ